MIAVRPEPTGLKRQIQVSIEQKRGGESAVEKASGMFGVIIIRSFHRLIALPLAVPLLLSGCGKCCDGRGVLV
jgi:hypothetical protein